MKNHTIAAAFSIGAIFFIGGCVKVFGSAGGVAAAGLSMMLFGIKYSLDQKLDLIWRRVWRQS